MKVQDKEELIVGHSAFEPYPHDTHKLPIPKVVTVTKEEYEAKEFAHLKAIAEEQKRRLSEPPALASAEKPKEAMRFVADKMRFDLLPIEALIELTRVYDSGALKYDDNNWRKGMKWSLVYRPIFSHLFKWLLGQTVDKETGCHHLMMVAWNCITLFVYQLRRLGTDDRASILGIDENFNWVDNHLGLGLSPEQKTELKDKYRKQREKHNDNSAK